jgi:glycosyltransferase involved in cell wall biosynthesis
MDIYWYWPFMRKEEFPWAAATTRPGDTLAVQTLARPDSLVVPSAAVTVYRDLPDVEREANERSLRWYVSRPLTYTHRSRLRSRDVRRGRFDVAHVMFLNQFTDWYALQTIRRTSPLVLSVHDALPHQRRLPEQAQVAVLRRIIRSADHIVVHHDYVRQRVECLYGVGGDSVSTVPLPVPEMPLPHKPGDGALRVLFFGSLRRNKGITVLLDALGRLPIDAPIQVHLAGRGSADVEAVASQAAERMTNLTAEIGWVSTSRKAELYAEADLVVLPYTSFESQSGVLHDAYAAGLPVIVTDVGALGESVRADGTGWVIEAGDAAALAATLLEVAADPSGRARAAAAARKVASERSFEHVGRRLRDIYDFVTAGAAHR